MPVKGYILVNITKAEEALRVTGGNEEAALAEYDKRGGLIKDKNGESVPTGTFWDFQKGAPVKKESKKKAAPKGAGKGKGK